MFSLVWNLFKIWLGIFLLAWATGVAFAIITAIVLTIIFLWCAPGWAISLGRAYQSKTTQQSRRPSNPQARAQAPR